MDLMEEAADLFINTEMRMSAISRELDIGRFKLSSYLKENNIKKDMIGIIQRELDKYGYKLISKEYVGWRDELIYECPIHGAKVSCWDYIKKGKLCMECSRDKYKLSYSDVKKAFENRGYELIDREYKNTGTPLKFICPNHGVQYISYSNLVYNRNGCVECANEARRNPEYEVIKAFTDRRYHLISSYKDAQTPLYYFCRDHGLQKIAYSSLRAGHGCSECAKSKYRGAYNLTLADRNREDFINEKAKVYLIKAHLEEESFLKIGITVRSIRKRFSGYFDHYEILDNIDTNLYDAIYLEDKILSNYDDYKFMPKGDFGGRTECLSVEALSRLKEDFVNAKNNLNKKELKKAS